MRDIKLNPINEVLEKIRDNFTDYTPTTEIILIDDAKGRIAAKDIISEVTIPEFRKSCVDGYAIKYMKKAMSRELIDDVKIGTETNYQLKPLECIYVPTGGMLPKGTDVMVKIEETIKEEESIIFFKGDHRISENIIEVGDDVKIGDLVIKKNNPISIFDIGALTSMGLKEVEVLKKQRISIISTGDELITDNEKMSIGKVRDINTKTLSLLSREYDLEVTNTYVVSDDYKGLLKTAKRGLKHSDILIISGGSSVGKTDYTFDIINELGSPGVITDGIAMKPGKPTIVGKVNNKPVLGLPGHPVSAIMTFRIIMKEILKSRGYSVKEDYKEEAILSSDIYAAKGRDTFQMVNVKLENGKKIAYPTSGKSGTISLLTKSNAYVLIPKLDLKREKDSTVICCYF